MKSAQSVRRKSGLRESRNPKSLLDFLRVSLGHSCPQRCPSPGDAPEPFGAPLSLREVATLIGCSPWTVRQTLMPQGLPHFRSGAGGKLIFYTNQVVRWIESRQPQGGIR